MPICLSAACVSVCLVGGLVGRWWWWWWWLSSTCYQAQVRYESLEDVQRALRRLGLERSELIIGIDFTKSNEWTGTTTSTS